MTKNQIKLMKRCIAALRLRQKASEDSDQEMDTRDTELVEVGWINGVDPRTATSLVEAGVLVTDVPSYATEYTGVHVRLPRLDEITEKNK